MIVNESHIQIAAVLAQVPIACEFVARAALQAGLDEHAAYHCQLAVDEACTNIVEHAYRMHGENQIIDIVCQTDNQRFTIIIMDDGPAFNPLAQPDPDPTAPLDRRGSGGWGIHFIRKFMDEVGYSREANRNCLTIIKRLPA
ncbi:MAG: ATP-binding protein [Chloroflexi bacterium]|nr:ATP-binding protein [Chloroflexota bacterium]